MNYKIVAIDLDGTLLTDDKKISEDNLYILKRLMNKGIEIVIATGRRYWSAKEFINSLNRNVIIISNNGNIVRSINDDRILIEKYLNIKDFKNIVIEGKKQCLHPIVHINDYENEKDILVEYDINDKKYRNYLNPDEKRYKMIDNLLNYKENKVLVVCYLDEYKKLENFMKTIEKKYPERFSHYILTNLKRTDSILEIMTPLGSKWKSLIEYAYSKGISAKEIVTIGDDNNDIEMIKKSGLGIAMRNASDKAKEYADIISNKDNNNSGVAFELKKIFNIS
ncbi:Cof-type HAD-IIB family hydrolase [Clostridium sp. D2Q-14]|uniref:Cof-type HAD-IIB family hydrolase n=1 Tax=Anaeromonas gelatinilytica TaxID=2683194 RepID=UPI00193BE6F4|nr:Cof-type HAD-IIB family hydrolase [Anaeromonas gelatinilytica]MBS4536566.1 Cof-type HAD-IIB family hydrolase [Anaeromonas gelatinilytica]